MKNYTITVNGNIYEVQVEENTSSTPVAQMPARNPVVKEPVKQMAAAPKMAPVSGGGKIKINAPMPGTILSIKASEGQNINKGEVIAILEAMKMENEIVAPEDGVIASINVAANQVVEAGEVLATLN